MKNPWAAQQTDAQGKMTGRWLEPQRADLFTVDFSAPLKIFRAILTNVSSSAQAKAKASELLRSFPTEIEMICFARSVDFSEMRVAADSVRQHEVPRYYPGMEETAGSVTISFFQDAGTTDEARSRILAFLRTWQAVVRAGRAGQTPRDLSLSLLDARDPQGASSSIVPDFRHDFVIKLWRGAVPTATNTMLVAGADTPRSPFFGVNPMADQIVSTDVELSGQWEVQAGWLGGVQLSSVSHQRPEVQEVRATFYCDAVLEVSSLVGMNGSLSLNPNG